MQPLMYLVEQPNSREYHHDTILHADCYYIRMRIYFWRHRLSYKGRVSRRVQAVRTLCDANFGVRTVHEPLVECRETAP